MTNRERILKIMANMSDEEMAVKIMDRFGICRSQDNIDKCSEYKDCISCYLNWLKSEQKEAIKLTEAERTILENIDKNYKWIARNCDGRLDVYTAKPIKNEENNYWDFACNEEDCENEKLVLFEHLFKFVEWEDKEPYNIEELLKGD